MRRIAQHAQPVAPPDPRHRVPEKTPQMHGPDPFEKRLHLRPEIGKGRAQGHRIIALAPAFGAPGGAFLNGHQVQQGAAAQGIADQMPVRAHMQPDVVQPAGVIGHQRAPRHLPGKERCARPVQLGPRHRMQPIGAHDQVRLDLGSQGQLNARAWTRHDPVRLLQQKNAHPGLACRVMQKVDQIRPVKEVKPAHRAEIHPYHRPAPVIRQFDPSRQHRRRPRALLKPERAQHGHAVGADLKPGTHLGDFAGLLQHRDIGPAQRKGPRHRQPADARADHGNSETFELHSTLAEKKNAGA